MIESTTVIDRANARDRAFFATHPTAETYIRPVVTGEFLPFTARGDALVEVRRIAPGVRSRRLIVGAGGVHAA